MVCGITSKSWLFLVVCCWLLFGFMRSYWMQVSKRVGRWAGGRSYTKGVDCWLDLDRDQKETSAKSYCSALLHKRKAVGEG